MCKHRVNFSSHANIAVKLPHLLTSEPLCAAVLLAHNRETIAVFRGLEDVLRIHCSNLPRPSLLPDRSCGSNARASRSADQVGAFENVSPSRVLKWSAVGAAYGAAVGAGTACAYNAFGLQTGTAVHMTGILAGGVVGAAVLGKELQSVFERPMCYAMGTLLGAGLTWATSAFGILQNPVLGAVAGGTLGAFYGALGAAIIPQR